MSNEHSFLEDKFPKENLNAVMYKYFAFQACKV
jgi:hypothetical protein